MSRDKPFNKYLHNSVKRTEVPMHSHINGQLSYIGKGTVSLLSLQMHWVVPWQRIIWIPPGQPHSMRCENLSESWKVMVPKDFVYSLPKDICVLQTSPLLLAVLEALPVDGEVIAPEKRTALAEVIKLELLVAQHEEFGIPLPRSKKMFYVAEKIMQSPEDARVVDEWAQSIGMSRRTFTRHFRAETGTSFNQWKKSVLFGKALVLLAEGKSVAETSDQLGYANQSAFVAAFRRKYGIPPRKFNNGL